LADSTFPPDHGALPTGGARGSPEVQRSLKLRVSTLLRLDSPKMQASPGHKRVYIIHQQSPKLDKEALVQSEPRRAQVPQKLAHHFYRQDCTPVSSVEEQLPKVLDDFESAFHPEKRKGKRKTIRFVSERIMSHICIARHKPWLSSTRNKLCT